MVSPNSSGRRCGGEDGRGRSVRRGLCTTGGGWAGRRLLVSSVISSGRLMRGKGGVRHSRRRDALPWSELSRGLDREAAGEAAIRN